MGGGFQLSALAAAATATAGAGTGAGVLPGSENVAPVNVNTVSQPHAGLEKAGSMRMPRRTSFQTSDPLTNPLLMEHNKGSLTQPPPLADAGPLSPGVDARPSGVVDAA